MRNENGLTFYKSKLKIFLTEHGLKLLAEHLKTVFKPLPVHHIPQRCMYKLVSVRRND